MSSPEPSGGAHRLIATLIAAVALLTVALALCLPAAAPTAVVILAIFAAVLGIRQAFNHARIRELRIVATAYAKGDIERRVAVAGFDSLAQLGRDLNTLGEHLATTRTALESQRGMLDGALGSLNEGVACLDDLDRIVYANPAWRHLAAGGQQPTGAAFYEQIQAAALSAAVTNARGGGRADGIEFEHRRRRLRATVAQATPTTLVVVLHDLTELKRLEGARREFVAAISHELKTPLTAIAGFAETLLDGTLEEDPAAARGFIEKIARHADRLTVLVRDVLTLSRLEQGAWEVHPGPLQIPEIVQQLVEEQVQAANTRQVRLVIDGPAQLAATTDRELLHQLLGNLVSNAIRYNRADGSVTISYAADDDRLHLAVADTGIGIPAEHRERVFERFYRVDAHRSRASGGTGLGLAIVKQLVDALQGTITLESGNQGTTFRVVLPRTDPRSGR